MMLMFSRHTGKGSADYALRDAVPNLDHHVPPAPPDLWHIRAS